MTHDFISYLSWISHAVSRRAWCSRLAARFIIIARTAVIRVGCHALQVSRVTSEHHKNAE
jgi:hypothetical protein